MTTIADSAALSHVGKVRSNNQDSGYAGTHLFVVADGMGGHAGGDVASAIALHRIVEADLDYPTAEDAAAALQTAIIAANGQLSDAVAEHPELTGMGTTVDALALVGDRVAIAHIGDSRVYLLRDGELSQITTDHTFVQRLVDAGRITEEEALVHPRRSVLMRVLGDVDQSPEVDIIVMQTKPGDRWLLCSDGLSGVIDNDTIRAALATTLTAAQVTGRLVKYALDRGAPDNVTVVIYDTGDDREGLHTNTVGSASKPLGFELTAARRTGLLPSLRLHGPRTTAVGPSHFEPAADEYYGELIEEQARQRKRHRLTWLVGGLVLVLVLVLGGLGAYGWTQSQFYVGASQDGQTVTIYQGVHQKLGPLELSHEYRDTGIALTDLSAYERAQVERVIPAGSIEDALAVVDRLRVISKESE